jgi:hypothetical protein
LQTIIIICMFSWLWHAVDAPHDDDRFVSRTNKTSGYCTCILLLFIAQIDFCILRVILEVFRKVKALLKERNPGEEENFEKNAELK